MRTIRMLLIIGVALGVAPAVERQAASAASMPATTPARFSGTLVRLDGASLVIRPIGAGITRDFTVATDALTEFQVDAQPGRLVDLRPGMAVSIVPAPQTPQRPFGLVVRATSKEASGTVLKVGDGNVIIEILQPDGNPQEVTLATDEKTKVVFPGNDNDSKRLGAVNDLKAGMQVWVAPSTGTAAVITAVASEGFPPAFPAARAEAVLGTLVKTEGNTLLVDAKQAEGGINLVTVATDDNTEYLVDGEAASLQNLGPGMRVAITPLPQTMARPAKLTVEAMSKSRNGTIIKRESTNVVIETRRPDGQPTQATVATDERTKVITLCLARGDWFFRPKIGRLEDLKAGMRVEFLPETGTASKIIVHLVGVSSTQPASLPAPKQVR